MKELRVNIAIPEGKGKPASMGIAWKGPGPFVLRDIAKSLAAWSSMIDALERGITGKRTARLGWEIVSMEVVDVPDEHGMPDAVSGGGAEDA